MKPTHLYAILIPIVYALLFLMGNHDFDDQSIWEGEAAPWLGEPPAGMTAELVRAESMDEFPHTVFHLPANAALKNNIISTFELEETRPGIFENNGISIIYPSEKDVVLQVTSEIYPQLQLGEDGAMRFCTNNLNLRKQKNISLVKSLDVPYPQYLDSKETELTRSLLLAMLCYLFPGAFACITWLWFQKKPIRSRDTLIICVAIPAAVAFIGAYTDFSIHGFHRSYAIFSSVFSVFSNLICIGLLITLTVIGRWVWQHLAPKA